MNESKESKESTEKWENGFLIVCTIVTVIACLLAIWITCQNAKYAEEIKDLKDLKSEIVQAVVVDCDLDNMLLFVTNDIDDEQAVVEVEVLLEETEVSVTVAAERNKLIGRQVAYLSWQNKKVLLTIWPEFIQASTGAVKLYSK